jgi:hypothetical protein
MTDLTDLQIQFRLAKPASDGTQSKHEVLAMINGSGSWCGEATAFTPSCIPKLHSCSVTVARQRGALRYL